MAAITTGVIAAAGAVGGAYLSSQGSKSAANTQAAAADAATAEQAREYNQTQQNMQPWLTTGTSALNQLAQMYGLSTAGSTSGVTSGSSTGTTGTGTTDYSSFYNSPDYQFTLNQGLDAVKRNAAATGNLASGNTLTALNNYAQGAASTQLNNYTNRLASLAGVGQSTASTLGSLGTQTASNIANTTISAGNARASGIAGSTNAWGNALGTLGGLGVNYLSGLSSGSTSALNDPWYVNYLGNSSMSSLIPSGNGGFSL